MTNANLRIVEQLGGSVAVLNGCCSEKSSGDFMKRRRVILCFMLLASLLLAYLSWSVMLYFATYSPVLEAAEEVRRQGAKYGFRMEGFLGEITAEPNDAGECEVKLQFSDYMVDPPQRSLSIRARRTWALGQWEVVEVTEKLVPR